MANIKQVKRQNFYYTKVGNRTILKSYYTIVDIDIDNQ